MSPLTWLDDLSPPRTSRTKDISQAIAQTEWGLSKNMKSLVKIRKNLQYKIKDIYNNNILFI